MATHRATGARSGAAFRAAPTHRAGTASGPLSIEAPSIAAAWARAFASSASIARRSARVGQFGDGRCTSWGSFRVRVEDGAGRSGRVVMGRGSRASATGGAGEWGSRNVKRSAALGAPLVLEAASSTRSTGAPSLRRYCRAAVLAMRHPRPVFERREPSPGRCTRIERHAATPRARAHPQGLGDPGA